MTLSLRCRPARPGHHRRPHIDIAARIAAFDVDGTLENDRARIVDRDRTRRRARSSSATGTSGSAKIPTSRTGFTTAGNAGSNWASPISKAGSAVWPSGIGSNRWSDRSPRGTSVGVTTMSLLSMTCASDRAALNLLMRTVSPRTIARFTRFIDTLMRLFGMESEITVELYNGFVAHTAAAGTATSWRANSTSEIGITVEAASDESGDLRRQSRARPRSSRAACWERRAKSPPPPNNPRSRCARRHRPPRG